MRQTRAILRETYFPGDPWRKVMLVASMAILMWALLQFHHGRQGITSIETIRHLTILCAIIPIKLFTIMPMLAYQVLPASSEAPGSIQHALMIFVVITALLMVGEKQIYHIALTEPKSLMPEVLIVALLFLTSVMSSVYFTVEEQMFGRSG